MLDTIASTKEIDPISDYEIDPKELAFYRQEGWLLLPGLLRDEVVKDVHDSIMHHVEELGAKKAELENASQASSKLIQTSQYLKGSPLDGLVNSNKLLSVASGLLGAASTLYLPFTAVKSANGGGEFHFHQDNNYTKFEDGLQSVNIWFALVDMTPENGCLCVEPRSHLEGTQSSINVGQGDHHQKVAVDPEVYLPLRMRAGDAVAFSRTTVHGSGENHSNVPRVAYSIHFHDNEAKASWDDQPPRMVKGAGRWSTAPVESIIPMDDSHDK